MQKFVIPTAPEDISVEDFFMRFIPEQFERLKPLLDAVDVSHLQGKEYAVQSDIEGQTYTLVFKNGKELEVKEGAGSNPHLTVVMNEDDWRDAVSGKFFGNIEEGLPANPAELLTPKRYEAAMATKGTINLNIKKEEGGVLPLSMIFHGLSRPNVTIDFDLIDIQNLLSRKITPLSLFMSGRLKFTGDMLLLMRLQKFV